MLGLVFGIASGLFHSLGYFFYIKELLKENIRPNKASWLIWVIGAVLELWTYFIFTGDIVKNILPIICALGAIVTYFVATHKGKFREVTKIEKIIIGIDIIALIIWQVTTSAGLANIILVTSGVISFLPILKSAHINELKLPWIMWTIAYIFMIFTVYLRELNLIELIYPITYTILHLMVIIVMFIFKENKELKKFTPKK